MDMCTPFGVDIRAEEALPLNLVAHSRSSESDRDNSESPGGPVLGGRALCEERSQTAEHSSIRMTSRALRVKNAESKVRNL